MFMNNHICYLTSMELFLALAVSLFYFWLQSNGGGGGFWECVKCRASQPVFSDNLQAYINERDFNMQRF